MNAPSETYATTLARRGAEAFAFLVHDYGFAADQPVMSAAWDAARLIYRRDNRFVAIDVCVREAAFNVCLGRTVGDGLPRYPLFRPRADEPLEWVPLWAVAAGNGELPEPFVFPGPDDAELRRQLERWAQMLRAHAAGMLAGDEPVIKATGSFLPARQPPEDLGRPGAQPPLIIGQSQTARVATYAQATGSSVFQPPETMDDRLFLQQAASFMRGALHAGMAIRDIGPDPLLLGDGGYLYRLWRGVIQQHG